MEAKNQMKAEDLQADEQDLKKQDIYMLKEDNKFYI